MKKIIGIFSAIAILAGVFVMPVLADTTSTSTATSTNQTLIQTLQQQIASLMDMINTLKQQMQTILQTKSQIKEQAQTVLNLTRQLREGMNGDDVKLLQQILATDPEIYPHGLITGNFGKLTAKALKKFQEKICVEQTGNVGSKTMARINELLKEGAGNSGHVPPGLLIAPGIKKKLCRTFSLAPIISGLIATSTASTTTHIVWTTDKNANSMVWYSTLTPVDVSGSAQISDSNLIKNHDITLSSLIASTTYYCIVSSADASNNTATSTQLSFTTLAQ